jgi:hypothetical protein
MPQEVIVSFTKPFDFLSGGALVRCSIFRLLRHSELHLLETRQRDPDLYAKDFDRDDLIALVEIKDNAWMHLLGFNDLGLVKSEIDCVGLFVEM